MNKIIDGRKIARDVLAKVKKEIVFLKKRFGKRPKLVFVMVSPTKRDALLYANMQRKAAAEAGIAFDTRVFPKKISAGRLIDGIKKLDSDGNVTAIIVQHPLPRGIDRSAVSAISPEKDAEGIHPRNLGKLFRKEGLIVPCTGGAVMKILSARKIDLYGKDVVILGHSPIVGKPLSVMMLNEDATTSVCHIGTAEKGDVRSYTRKADVLVVAVGKPRMVKRNWIKKGAVVIDVGINAGPRGTVVGDVDYKDVLSKASLITPVPGGVGPVTVSILMRNVLRAFKAQCGV